MLFFFSSLLVRSMHIHTVLLTKTTTTSNEKKLKIERTGKREKYKVFKMFQSHSSTHFRVDKKDMYLLHSAVEYIRKGTAERNIKTYARTHTLRQPVSHPSSGKRSGRHLTYGGCNCVSVNSSMCLWLMMVVVVCDAFYMNSFRLRLLRR